MSLFLAELGATPSSRLKPAENGARFENGSRFGQVLTSLDKFEQVWTSLDRFEQVEKIRCFYRSIPI